MAIKSTKFQDFDTDKIVTTDQHSKDIGDLDRRVSQIEKKFGNHEKIADTLCETSSTAIKMQTLFSDNFLKMLCNDEKAKEAIVKLINQSDRNWFLSYVKKLGFATWSMLLLVIGAIAKGLIDNYLKGN